MNPEAARQAVLECLESNGGNVTGAARMFAVNRSVVYDIRKNQVQGAQAPAHQDPGRNGEPGSGGQEEDAPLDPP